MKVEVVAVETDGIVQRRMVDVPHGATVADVLSAAAITVPNNGVAAVHGRIKSAGESLDDGDRLDVCRPLTVDPKQGRSSRERMNRSGRR